MDLIPVDDAGLLFVAPEIDDWSLIGQRGICLVIDLDGEVDIGIPTVPDDLIYLYFPMHDGDLPDLVKLHALARLAADMVRQGQRVLMHCSLGINRSPLMAGVALTHLGFTGEQALERLRERRPAALYNEVFADYLASLAECVP